MKAQPGRALGHSSRAGRAAGAEDAAGDPRGTRGGQPCSARSSPGLVVTSLWHVPVAVARSCVPAQGGLQAQISGDGVGHRAAISIAGLTGLPVPGPCFPVNPKSPPAAGWGQQGCRGVGWRQTLSHAPSLEEREWFWGDQSAPGLYQHLASISEGKAREAADSPDRGAAVAVLG